MSGLTLGCGPSPAAEQGRVGAEIYRTRCAVCHDQEPAIGTKLDAATLRSYRTARALFDYTSFAMPYDRPRSMISDDYWAVTAHMLQRRDLLDAGTLLGPANADSISWSIVP